MIALIRSAISDRSRHAFPVEPRVVGVAGLLCVPGTGLWGWSDSSRRWYTHVIAVSLRSTESVFTNAGWIWPVGHHVTPDLESGEAGGLGTGNVKMNKPGVEVRGICCPYGLVSPAHQPR